MASDWSLFVALTLGCLVGIWGVEDLPHLKVLDFLAGSLTIQLLLAADSRKVHIINELCDLLRVGVVEYLADHTRQEILVLKLHLLVSFYDYFRVGRGNSGVRLRLPHFMVGLRPDEALEVI